MSIEMVGLADIVRAHGASHPDTVAIVYEGRRTSYGALDRASSRIASGLTAFELISAASLDLVLKHFPGSRLPVPQRLVSLAGTASARMAAASLRDPAAPPELLATR